MTEKAIKSISPIPLGLIMGVISGIMGLIATIIFGIFYFPIMSNLYLPETINISTIPPLVGIITTILIPVIAFAVGFIQGLLTAVIYNFIAPRIGGIKIKFAETL